MDTIVVLVLLFGSVGAFFEWLGERPKRSSWSSWHSKYHPATPARQQPVQPAVSVSNKPVYIAIFVLLFVLAWMGGVGNLISMAVR